MRQWKNIDRHIIVRFLINTAIQYNKFNSQSFFNYNIKEIIDESIIKKQVKNQLSAVKKVRQIKVIHMGNFKKRTLFYTKDCLFIGVSIFVIDIVTFVILIFLSMSDSESPILADYVHIFLKEVLSLPLSLINNDYPFFLDDHQVPKLILFTMPANILIQSVFFCFIKECITKILVTFSNKKNIE